MSNGERMAAVTYAVRPGVVLKYFGQLAALQGALACAPLVASLWFGEYRLTLAYAAVALLLAALGLPLARLPEPDRVLPNEALAVTALAFATAPLAMAGPFAAAGIPAGDALFEAVSAITTTGLSTLASVEHLPRTVLFARAWMQWYGGLGIVVLSVALLAPQGGAVRRLIEPQTAGEGLASTVRAHARRVLVVYLALTAVGAAALWLAGASPSQSIDHVLAAVSTGGFSTFDTSLAGFGSPAVSAVIMTLCACGAVSLPLYYRCWQAGPAALWRSAELRALLAALALVVALLAVLVAVHEGLPWLRALQRAAVLGVSAQTTAGFSDSPVSALGDDVLLVLMVAMLTGGSLGSTAGGIKLVRVLVLLRLARVAFRRLGAPSHAVIEPMLEGRRIEEADQVRALLLAALFAAVVLLSWFAFLAAGHDPMHALFEVVSATATVGLSTGITGPQLEPGLKFVLGLDMLLGRLEILALLVVIYPGTWFGKRVEGL